MMQKSAEIAKSLHFLFVIIFGALLFDRECSRTSERLLENFARRHCKRDGQRSIRCGALRTEHICRYGETVGLLALFLRLCCRRGKHHLCCKRIAILHSLNRKQFSILGDCQRATTLPTPTIHIHVIGVRDIRVVDLLALQTTQVLQTLTTIPTPRTG